ncbi:Glycerophosphoryl diester phosphodiesterase family-domain-containing protein, partial [Jimgerdemannia flammicorona]
RFDKKLHRETQTLYIDTKLNVLPFATSLAFTDMLDNLEGWITDLSQRVAQQEKNDSTVDKTATSRRQRVQLSEADTEAVRNALNDDEVEMLRSVLDRVIGTVGSQNQKLLTSILHQACQRKAFTCIDFLLSRGASIVDPDDINERTLLHKLAIHGGSIPEHKPGNPRSSSSFIPPLFYFQKTSPTTALRTRNAPASPTIPLDSTHKPAASDDIDIVAFILQRIPRGTPALQQDISGRYPIHYAAINGHARIARTLMEHMVVSGEFDVGRGFGDAVWFDHEGFNPVFYAVLRGHVEVIEALIDVGQIVNVDAVISRECESLQFRYLSQTGIDVSHHLLLTYDSTAIPTVKAPSTIHNALTASIHANGTSLPHEYVQTPLAIACKLGHTSTVDLLIKRGAQVNLLQDDEGETALHMAARGGYVECVKLLVGVKATEGTHIQQGTVASTEIKEKINGWTPLMVAGRFRLFARCIRKAHLQYDINYVYILHHIIAIEGHLDIVQILLDARSNPNVTDFAGWRSHEHAVFRGHLNVAKLLQPLTTSYKPPSLPLQPTDSSTSATRDAIPVERAYGHRYLQGQSMITITLGANDSRHTAPFVRLNHGRHPVLPSSAVSLVVSAKNAIGESVIVDLPAVQLGTAAAHHPEPIIFFTTHLDEVVLRFDVVPTYGSSRKKIVGRASALLASDQTFSVGAGEKASLRGQMTVPIVGAETLESIGSVAFEYVVVRTFEHPNMSIGSKHTYWKSITTQVIGHRGLGMNRASSANLQLGENTVMSFVTAASLGAEYVEFDVQLTKDLVPVIYHDWTVTETGLDIPMNAVTLEQFLNLRPSGQIKQYHTGTSEPGPMTKFTINGGASGNVDEVLNSGDESALLNQRARVKRSNSLGDISKRMPEEGKKQFTKTTKLGKMKGNGPGSIQAPFTTLAETFMKVPSDIGFNIEVKYPMTDEAEAEDLPPSHTELNAFVDTILRCVYDHAVAQDRKVIFSSFHPEVCLMLNLKQPNYPVFFLTDCGYFPQADVRCSSIQEATRFAKAADLLGIVTASEPVLEAPRMVRTIKETGLLLFTYGALNNEVGNAKLQRSFGVDAVIVDSVMAVRRGLQEQDS